MAAVRGHDFREAEEFFVEDLLQLVNDGIDVLELFFGQLSPYLFDGIKENVAVTGEQLGNTIVVFYVDAMLRKKSLYFLVVLILVPCLPERLADDVEQPCVHLFDESADHVRGLFAEHLVVACAYIPEHLFDTMIGGEKIDDGYLVEEAVLGLLDIGENDVLAPFPFLSFIDLLGGDEGALDEFRKSPCRGFDKLVETETFNGEAP